MRHRIRTSRRPGVRISKTLMKQPFQTATAILEWMWEEAKKQKSTELTEFFYAFKDRWSSEEPTLDIYKESENNE